VIPAVNTSMARSGHGVAGSTGDPEVDVAPVFIMTFQRKELMAQIGERMDFLWFLGFDWKRRFPITVCFSKASRPWEPRYSSNFLCARCGNVLRADCGRTGCCMWTAPSSRPMRPRIRCPTSPDGGGVAPSLIRSSEQTASAGASRTESAGSRAERSGREGRRKKASGQPNACQPD